MKTIKFKQLKKYKNEGLVLMGCGGSLNEWVEGVQEILKDENIATSSDFDEAVSLETSGGRVDILLPFAEKNKIKIGALAMWRLKFGDASWLSDYTVNYKDQHV